MKERSPKRELYKNLPLDRNSETETEEKTDEPHLEGARKCQRQNRTQNRLSTHARQTLQRVGGAAKFCFNVSDALFLTGTFPGGTFEYQSAIAANAGWIAHRLKAWIYKIVGANVAYWVWEFQRRGTLHLHYVVMIPDAHLRAHVQCEFRNEWIRLIKGASERSGVNLFIGKKGRDFFTEKELLQIYAQECYKSCASYLSKYLSKKKKYDFPSPCRLWGCTKEARLMVARSLVTVEHCSKTLQAATDLAWRYDSYSNVGNEKRRCFRHRFSQGFTILLYDDNLRDDLEKKDEEMSYNHHLNEALSRLSDKLLQVKAYNHIIGIATPSLKSRFVGGELNKYTEPTLKNLQQLQDDLKELDEVIQICGGIRHFHVNDVRNLIKSALWILNS